MSHQLEDPFYMLGNEYVFLGAENLESLFTPEQFGLTPSAPSTACWKGFVVRFRMSYDAHLFLDSFEIFCEDGHYPPINGIEPVPGDMGMQDYRGLNIALPYSGKILVGETLLPEYSHSAFTGPHSYSRILELTYENGKITGAKDVTEQHAAQDRWE